MRIGTPLFVVAAFLCAIVGCPPPLHFPANAVYSVTCTDDGACLTAATKLACADPSTAKCRAGECVFTPLSTCPCIERDIRQCPTDNTKYDYCIAANGTAGWDTTCSPRDCNPGTSACVHGTQQYDNADNSAKTGPKGWGGCTPDPKCGLSQSCSAMSGCTGTQMYNGVAWDTCLPTCPTWRKDEDNDHYCDSGSTRADISPGTGYVLAAACQGEEPEGCETNPNCPNGTVTPPPINYDHIRIVIQTGNDDARKDSEVWAAIDGQNLCLKPSNNANNDGICPNGGSSKDQNGRQNWTNWSTSDLRFAVGAFTASAISSLQLHFVTHNHNGEGDDNWDLEGFRIFAQAAGQPDLQLYTAGKLDLSTGDDCMFRFGPHGGWQATWNFSTGGPPSSCPQ